MKSAYQKVMEERLTSLIEPLVIDCGCELVEVQLVQRKANALVRILVDKVGGVNIDECAEISRRVSFQLEVEDPIENRYTLEVSSPGLDRPLTTPADFRRKVGEVVKIMARSGEKDYDRTGEIVRVDERYVYLKTDEGEENCPLSEIIKGKIIF